jgi:hypothetical protein
MPSIVKIDGMIPVEIKYAANDWWHILLNNIPFMVTISIVVGSALVTYLVNRKAIANQGKQADLSRNAEHENKISEFRHHWLQEVRNTAAELATSIHECQIHLVLTNLARDNGVTITKYGVEDEAIIHSNEIAKHYDKQVKSIANFYKHSSKIKLLFKKDDPETKRLFSLLDEIRSNMSDVNVRRLRDEDIDNMVSELQIILKNEWEVTKDRSWRKSQ